MLSRNTGRPPAQARASARPAPAGNGRWKTAARRPRSPARGSPRGRPARRPARAFRRPGQPSRNSCQSGRSAWISALRAALVFAVVPFDQIAIDFRRRAEAGQLAGARRALQRTGEHLGKRHSAQPLAKRAGVPFAALGQRQIGQPGVLAREAPRGFAVPGQVNDRKSSLML